MSQATENAVPGLPTREAGLRPARDMDVAGLGRARAGLFVAPALTLIGLFLLFPAIWTIYLGMTNYKLTGLSARAPDFVGLDNYTSTLTDPTFISSLRLTLIFVLLSGVVGQSLLGFSVAWTMRTVRPVVKSVTEFLVLVAWIVPSSVGSFLWIAMLDRSNGTLNALLRSPGTAWLVQYPMASIVLFNIWIGTAFSMLLFSSALASVPPSQMESARMVGASSGQLLRDVVVPHIRGHILTNTLLITLWTFNTFTPFLLTAGGPNHQSEILPVYLYNVAITGGHLGVGAAIALIMLLINLMIAAVYIRVLRERK